VRAIDLVEQIPVVTPDTSGAEAARIVAEHRLQALVVVGADGRPTAVIPGSLILGLIIPTYVRDDPNLAHAFDEQSADELATRLTTSTIDSLLDSRDIPDVKPPAVAPEDTLLEIASEMVRSRCPLVLVRDEDGTYHGAVVMSRVLAAVAALAGEDSDLVQRRLTQDILEAGALPTDRIIGESPA